MSARSRVAFAAGVAGLTGATLLLTGRFDGTVALALLFVAAGRIAAPAALVDGGPVLADAASRSLLRQVSFAPAWALVVATGAIRAGSAVLADARGANAVAGLALARGPLVTVIGSWLAVAAGVVALSSRAPVGVDSAAVSGSNGRVLVPVPLRRLETGAVVAQAALLVTLFAGPQITEAADSIAWVVGIASLATVVWVARDMEVRLAAPIATVLGALGFVLAIAGGAP